MKDGQTYSFKQPDNCIGGRYVRSAGRFSAPAGRSSGSQTEASMHLLSQLVQEELATIALAIETSTLDVERNHNLDRRSEACCVSSVAKAS